MKTSVRAGLLGLFVGALSCSAAPPADTPSPVVPIPSASGGACAQGAKCGGAGAAASVPSVPVSCVEGTRGAGCDGIVGPEEEKGLGASVDAARDAMLKSMYTDVHSIVELARLSLRRDAEVADADAQNDASRALKNAMRAVAVDDAAAAPRIALTMARARSLVGAKMLSDPGTRGQALGLVELSLRRVPVGTGAAGAAAKTLEGYLALERGDRATAKVAFEAATKLDPELGSAWVGLGDAARATGAFEAAQTAYKTAMERLPKDAGVKRSMEAATRREALSLPSAPGVFLAIETDDLAPPPPAVQECPTWAKAAPENAKICAGLTDLAKATTRDDKLRAAKQIVEGWNDIRPLCDKRDPACGLHVAPALAAAARGFQAGGLLAKAIAANLILLGHADLPGATGLFPAAALENADRYFAIGVYDTAADFYERNLQLTQQKSGPVARRALALRIGLGNAAAAQKLAAGYAADSKVPATDRAAAVLAVGGLLRISQGPDAAKAWASPYTALLQDAGKADEGRALAAPTPEGATPGCASLLGCAIRRLSGEARWAQ